MIYGGIFSGNLTQGIELIVGLPISVFACMHGTCTVRIKRMISLFKKTYLVSFFKPMLNIYLLHKAIF